MKKSLWSNETVLPEHEPLCSDIKTDVLIIGGGICGVLCACFLKQSGVNCVIAEAKKLAGGTTANTTAKITSLHGLIYNDLINSFGIEFAEKYLYINELAIDKYANLCKNANCRFERMPAYTYSLNDRVKIEREVLALEKAGAKAKFSSASFLPFDISGSVCMPNQAQFNPLEFIKHISKDLTIYENTMVRDITPKYAVCGSGAKIYADKIIVATHFPFINRHGNYFLKLYQYRSYVMALENVSSPYGMYVDEADDGLSFRTSDSFLLLGGGGGRTGKPCGNWHELERIKAMYYPDSKIKYRWATQDCISLDRVPYIGQYSPNTPNLYVASGFNKWGMTSSMAAAIILCDMINDKPNDCADIFMPSRSILKSQLFINGIETISNLVYPTKRRCPHLGCALKWNKAEHSWDCSCHGSRFDKDGSLINNPATKNAKVK